MIEAQEIEPDDLYYFAFDADVQPEPDHFKIYLPEDLVFGPVQMFKDGYWIEIFQDGRWQSHSSGVQTSHHARWGIWTNIHWIYTTSPHIVRELSSFQVTSDEVPHNRRTYKQYFGSAKAGRHAPLIAHWSLATERSDIKPVIEMHAARVA